MLYKQLTYFSLFSCCSLIVSVSESGIGQFPVQKSGKLLLPSWHSH